MKRLILSKIFFSPIADPFSSAFFYAPVAAPLVFALFALIVGDIGIAHVVFLFLFGSVISYAAMMSLGTLVLWFLSYFKWVNFFTILIFFAGIGAVTMWFFFSGTGQGIGAIFGAINAAAFVMVEKISGNA